MLVMLVACGTFPLGNVKPQAGKSADQEKLDILVCKDQAPQPAALPAPGIDALKMDWPAGFEARTPTDTQRRSGVVAVAVNRAADVAVQVVADRHQGVTDVSTYAVSKRAALLSRLGSG